MDIERIREYSLSLPMSSEDMAFGDDYLLFRVCGRIFACYGFAREDYFVVKCDAERAILLREAWGEIEPAWHWNKKYWNQIRIDGNLPDELIFSLIRHSYNEVVKKLPKHVLAAHPEIRSIE